MRRPPTRRRDDVGEAADDRVTPLDTAAPALLAVALRAFGTVRLRALGGSMEPAIRSRDILLVSGCRVADLRLGDIVLYARDGHLIAHRLIDVGIRADKRALVTRGDALWAADLPFDAGDLLGRVIAVGRRSLFRAPAGRTRLARVRGLVTSEWTALRVRLHARLSRRTGSGLGISRAA